MNRSGKLLSACLSVLSIVSCSDDSDDTPVVEKVDSSFLQSGNWVSKCKTEGPFVIGSVEITHIIETLTYHDNGKFNVVVIDYSDSECTSPSGYSVTFEVSYDLGGVITTSSGVEAYEVNEVLLSGSLLGENSEVIENIQYDGSTDLDILKVENDTLYFGIGADDERPNALDFNDPYMLNET